VRTHCSFRGTSSTTSRSLLTILATLLSNLGKWPEGLLFPNVRIPSAGALSGLRSACATPGLNTMPAMLEAVNAYFTLGEICGVMRQMFGEYQESVVV
jgi:hypothetical protein